jgi:hypothetical protein
MNEFIYLIEVLIKYGVKIEKEYEKLKIENKKLNFSKSKALNYIKSNMYADGVVIDGSWLRFKDLLEILEDEKND